MQLFFGFLFAILIAYSAYRAHSLSQSGAFAAALVGTIVLGLGGWQWAILLLAFFVSSSLLTHAFKNRKQGLDEKFSKGGERDAGQVLGNGAVAAVFVLLHAIFPASSWTWIGFSASLAAVNADTWATELGVLNPTPPRLITDLRKRVQKGTSGGVSLFGTFAALFGSALIALLATLFSPTGGWLLFSLITMSGLLGSLFDSLLGASVQAIYLCPADNQETEKHPLHSCGTPTVRIRGWKWLNNDWVNFMCGLGGVVFAQSLYAIFF
ncbi:MAG TPA: DUF92 domain-containing protein [Anaerolineales bacterium]|jgi:uncharacterized protein (TIGR00297 family)|nr:DUF92 domain-containing protein [Anaerolineales bacterium]